MSTLHHICTSCFFKERRGFTFTGSVPASDGRSCPVCGARTHRVVRLAANELGPDARLVWEGGDITVSEPRWERLRQTILGVLTSLWRFDVERRSDGLLEIPIRGPVSLLVRPVHDQITGQEGCLLASVLGEAGGEPATAVRHLLGRINDTLGEPVLLLGTMRDLFTMADARPAVFYRQFVPRAALLDPEDFAARIDRARRLTLLLCQAFETYGCTRAALEFVQRIDTGEVIEVPTNDDSWDVAASELIANEGAVDLEEMLDRADQQRGPRATRDEVRDMLFDLLLGMGLELDVALAAFDEDAEEHDDDDDGDDDIVRMAVHHAGVGLVMTFERDERDSYLTLDAPIARLLELDDGAAHTIVGLMDAPGYGELMLRETGRGDEIAISIRETLLIDDVDLPDLARVLADVTERVSELRARLAPIAASAPPVGASLGPVVAAGTALTDRLTPGAREEQLTRQVLEVLDALQLRPTLTRDGDFELTFDAVRVRLCIDVGQRGASVVVQARLVEQLGVSVREAVQAVIELDAEPRLGSFRFRDDGRTLVFEDRVPAGALDLNELVRTLHEVALVALGHRSELRRRLETDAQRDDRGDGWAAVVGGLVARYRRGPDLAARVRFVRAVSMFDHPLAAQCLTDALRDPWDEVGHAAIAGLIAASGAEHAPDLDAILDLAADERLGDGLRMRAVRVLGSADEPLERVVGALASIARSEHTNSIALRLCALQAIAALGDSKPIVDVLVRLVQDDTHEIAQTALRALGRIERVDPGRLMLATQGAVDALEHRDARGRGEILDTLATLGMQETVVDLTGEDLDVVPPEVLQSLARAATSSSPPRLETLARMLQHARGGVREAVLNALVELPHTALVETIVDVVQREPDPTLRATCITLLGKLAPEDARIRRILTRLGQDPLVGEHALAASRPGFR